MLVGGEARTEDAWFTALYGMYGVRVVGGGGWNKEWWRVGQGVVEGGTVSSGRWWRGWRVEQGVVDGGEGWRVEQGVVECRTVSSGRWWRVEQGVVEGGEGWRVEQGVVKGGLSLISGRKWGVLWCAMLWCTMLWCPVVCCAVIQNQ